MIIFRPQNSHTLAKSLTWSRCALGVLLMMILGPLISQILLSSGWWLIPPLFDYTKFIYLIPSLAWLLALAICMVLRPVGRWLYPASLGMVGLFQLFLILVAIPVVTASNKVEEHAWVTERNFACHWQQLAQARTLYACLPRNHMSRIPQFLPYWGQPYLFEGFSYSPLLKRLGHSAQPSKREPSVPRYSVDWRGIDFRGVDFGRMDLSRVNLGGADLRGAKLQAVKSNPGSLNGASYDLTTIWPKEFEPDKAGMILEEAD